MGNWCLLDKPNIELIDETPKGSEYNYLRPEGIIIYSLDRMYDVPEKEIDFNGWYKRTARLWPKNSKMRTNFLRWKRTLVPSPTVSSLS